MATKWLEKNNVKHQIFSDGFVQYFFVCSHLAFSENVRLVANTINAPEKQKTERLEKCSFVTHDCEICLIATTGKVNCSSVGIACEATKWTCLRTEHRVQPRR